MRSVLLAGVQSGSGKTTATLALIQYLLAQKQTVRGFKSGPDFLDPLWHRKLTGYDSYNLDTRMIGADESQTLLLQAQSQHSDVAVIEGVMGLFDGREGVGKNGSSAHLAQTLSLDVWLVVDAKGMSGSIVPLVYGFMHYAKKTNVRISGIIANRVGSAHHAQLLKAHLVEHDLPPLMAWLDKSVPTLPERHLGLVKPDEHPLPDFSQHFHVEVDDLIETIPKLKKQAQALLSYDKQTNSERNKRLNNKVIAVAYDDACCFIYPANIDWLKQQGAEVQFFSPIAGDPVPAGSDALWLPGGYPELHARALENSASWTSLLDFVKSGKPILAECGGMMLLGKVLVDHQGKSWKMADILPIETKMQDKLASLGYRECTEGDFSGLKGHEFHHSTRTELEELTSVFVVSRGDKGIDQANIKASYIHWYFASAPQAASQFFLI
ncbi:MAG: cobyrinate a,c-diamide synthase [gamma proteobacterium symbiont of Bathyaustriella thionipta]|nr:cobyrinate a,c-diamide synthase [gamma proteobacterium symbiont of Bathyaustriella thionipta]MCU7949639.1 cobyrinate a,c-diamide synthase [gamma proteobacterium symbiont of Bathyaustriella thionipta]MCU7954830.1 cobyrinate a,c-diamide synthase [gamma proteobacterium symbiont of Bathyaustriella thionipta]MCU7956218.1 cobyrinate a,c-diamide synthase [gamma proteobacterium symbiont of Bathyaustriella thionipta]MCU7966064.1 cobyrinate a,c-diamide synthase [gamma proteobacterium symbiont of Bathy